MSQKLISDKKREQIILEVVGEYMVRTQHLIGRLRDLGVKIKDVKYEKHRRYEDNVVVFSMVDLEGKIEKKNITKKPYTFNFGD